MQILQIPDGIDPIPTVGGRPLEPGKDYIVTNAFAGVMLLSRYRVKRDDKMWSLRLLLKSYSIEFDRFDPEEDWNNKEVWLFRGGGYGDLMLMTPLIRELRKRWPKISLHIACGHEYRCVFDWMDVICEDLPIPYGRDTYIDGLIEFEEIVEGDPKAEELHMAQLFADRAGITLTDLKPEYRVTIEEEKWAWETYPANHLPRIGVQLLASAFYRTYPKMVDVMLALAKEAQVFLIGAPGQIQLTEEIPNVTNLMDHKLDFRHSAGLVSTCDVCVSPDSALVHLCSALNISCVSLYGPFPSRLRLTSDLAHSFDGFASCAPCFFHADRGDQFPEGMPCVEAKKCVALDSISLDDVVAKVMSLASRVNTPRHEAHACIN